MVNKLENLVKGVLEKDFKMVLGSVKSLMNEKQKPDLQKAAHWKSIELVYKAFIQNNSGVHSPFFDELAFRIIDKGPHSKDIDQHIDSRSEFCETLFLIFHFLHNSEDFDLEKSKVESAFHSFLWYGINRFDWPNSLEKSTKRAFEKRPTSEECLVVLLK